MELNGPLCNVFRRAATFLPAAKAVVESRDGATVPDSFCAVSFDPPLVALTFPLDASALPGAELSVSVPGVRLECKVIEKKEIGDHVMLFADVKRVEIRGGRPKVKWRGAWFELQFSYPFLESPDILEGFVRDWRTGVLPKERWTHSAHVAVTGYYAFEHGPDVVFAEMKRGILHFNSCTGVANGPDGGYHETLTRFWSNRITLSVHDAKPESRLDAATHAVGLFGEDRDLPALFYSFNVVSDRRARREWVAPDVEPLPAWC
jgi:hypothetical protein